MNYCSNCHGLLPPLALTQCRHCGHHPTPAVSRVVPVPVRLFAAMFMVMIAVGVALGAETYGPYRADVVKVTDGDTVKMALAVAPGMVWNVAVRVRGVDTPEKQRYGRGRAVPLCEKLLAAHARRFTREWLDQGPVTVDQVAQGKWAGRTLGTVTRNGESLSAALIAAGHGRPYGGGNRGGWCR